ncbi:MarR family transcriptional regulator [Micromonospora globispora]|uniref:MarR family transcriptional regulator n=1 Tax=Micromonospora globispora TaxID=1450148 RepID=A0A317JUQ9_9ACTN|nr:MarR family transcriptional regulator [Micromonospora globispora]PWU44345.1 MarR family transcriptional regulator [Micromonospora globispora]
MTGTPDREALGTLLRHVLDLLDGDVATVYADLDLAEYRPRFSPLVRVLVADGPLPIRDLATRVGVTHSAASQTVAQMSRAGLVTLRPGADARQRIVALTDRAYVLLPVIEAERAATTTAMRDLDAELPVPLADELYAVLAALRRRPLRDRIAGTGLAPRREDAPAPHRGP